MRDFRLALKKRNKVYCMSCDKWMWMYGFTAIDKKCPRCGDEIFLKGELKNV